MPLDKLEFAKARSLNAFECMSDIFDKALFSFGLLFAKDCPYRPCKTCHTTIKHCCRWRKPHWRRIALHLLSTFLVSCQALECHFCYTNALEAIFHFKNLNESLFVKKMNYVFRKCDTYITFFSYIRIWSTWCDL